MKIVHGIVLSVAAMCGVGSALADHTGQYGTVAQVSVNETTADEYSAARGRLVIDEGGQFYRSYQWGGVACNGRNMSEANIANMMLALKDRGGLTLTPIWKVGAGAVRCLVAYRITGSDVVQ